VSDRKTPNPKTRNPTTAAQTRAAEDLRHAARHNRAAHALRLAAWALMRSKSYPGAYLRRQRSRLGAPKAITASLPGEVPGADLSSSCFGALGPTRPSLLLRRGSGRRVRAPVRQERLRHPLQGQLILEGRRHRPVPGFD
jgi:hypothetical protein